MPEAGEAVFEGSGAAAVEEWLRTEAPVLLLEIGRDGTVLSFNPQAEEVLGREPSGSHFRTIVVDFGESLDPTALAAEGGRARRLSLSTASGFPRDFLCSFLPSESGTLLLGVPNVEEDAALGSQVLALNRDLGNLTRELQKANAELVQLNQMKNQFLGMATHDLRTPLGLIIGFTELLKDETQDRLEEEEREYLDKVLSWAEHMQKLVDDFLNVSVIESGGMELDLALTELSSVVERVLSATEAKAAKKGVELRVDEEPGIPPLIADKERLGQALTNLVANAIEFSFQGSHVEVRTSRERDLCFLEVQDHGVGMDEEDMGKLFSPFGKAKGKKTGGEKSTGLGLVITRRILEAHGGQVSVESRPGEGSLFRVSLPMGND